MRLSIWPPIAWPRYGRAQSRGQEVEIGANASVQVKLEPQTLQ